MKVKNTERLGAETIVSVLRIRIMTAPSMNTTSISFLGRWPCGDMHDISRRWYAFPMFTRYVKHYGLVYFLIPCRGQRFGKNFVENRRSRG